MTEHEFAGAKMALFVGQRLLITLRDTKDNIPYPGLWDFAGGGREGAETPEQTVLREVEEELGLIVPKTGILWKRRYPANYLRGTAKETAQVWFFVAQIDEGQGRKVVFGDEGQGWAFVSLEGFLDMPHVVPSYAGRVRDWLDETGGAPVFGTK